jgi:hypothetical protein
VRTSDVDAVQRGLSVGPTSEFSPFVRMNDGRFADHPDRVEDIGAFNDGREPTCRDSDITGATPPCS